MKGEHGGSLRLPRGIEAPSRDGAMGIVQRRLQLWQRSNAREGMSCHEAGRRVDVLLGKGVPLPLHVAHAPMIAACLGNYMGRRAVGTHAARLLSTVSAGPSPPRSLSPLGKIP
jgi:hypothetical protein